MIDGLPSVAVFQRESFLLRIVFRPNHFTRKKINKFFKSDLSFQKIFDIIFESYFVYIGAFGEVSEWSKVLAWKAGVRE